MSGPYTIQVIPDASVRSGEHYRITDADDNRVATCYLRENAETVCRALNAARPAPETEREPFAWMSPGSLKFLRDGALGITIWRVKDSDFSGEPASIPVYLGAPAPAEAAERSET